MGLVLRRQTKFGTRLRHAKMHKKAWYVVVSDPQEVGHFEWKMQIAAVFPVSTPRI